MLDGWARKKIDPMLNAIAAAMAGSGVTPNAVTVASCAIGIAAAGAIAFHHYWLGLFLLLASRLGDGLDGALARIAGKTDFGGFLDIVLDFVFYGAIPMGFVLADPATNAVAGAALILSFYINGASFLAYAVMAEKRDLETAARGSKSLYFTTGLAEATETIAVFTAFCLFPGWFAPLAWLFAAICCYTALARIVQAAMTFKA
ncbi:MAG: CDP-alcohol phosphatidyltransferase family protein [Rhizobiaceae bacterium]